MQLAIVCDLNRCVGCHACSVACKMENDVAIGSFYNRVLRIGPTPKTEGASFPNVEMYYLPVMCQHCKEPECVEVCPTQASHKTKDGTVLINKEKCIGCQFCVMACPYGVRYLNPEQKVVEKCTFCTQLVAQGKEPMCVSSCVGKARTFGNIDDPGSKVSQMLLAAKGDVYTLPDVGNQPSFKYILRNAKWRG